MTIPINFTATPFHLNSLSLPIWLCYHLLHKNSCSGCYERYLHDRLPETLLGDYFFWMDSVIITDRFPIRQFNSIFAPA